MAQPAQAMICPRCGVQEMEPYIPLPPMYQTVVSEARLDRAIAAIGEAGKVLSRDQVIGVLFEIGYGDALDKVGPGGNPFELLTPLQHCAVAAALAVAAESKGKQEYVQR